MNFPTLNKVLNFTVLCLGVLLMQNTWAYSSADAMRLRTETPVVDGSMPPDIAAIQKRGVLRQGLFQVPAPPFSIQDSQGNWSGIEVDFGQRVAQQLGVKLQIVPAKTYEELVDLIVQDKVDMAMGFSILPIRQIKVSFSDPYYIYHPHLLVNMLAANQRGWLSPDQIIQGMEQTNEPLKIGIFAGNAEAKLIQQSFPNAQIITYQNHEQSFQDVASGKIFASIGPAPILIRSFLKNNPKAALTTEDVEITQMQDLLGIAIPWKSFHFREWLNVYIEYLLQNGIQQQLSEKYGFPIS